MADDELHEDWVASLEIPAVTHGVTMDPDADDDRGVSNADIANAVRAHLKMASHIPVTITESPEIDFTGKWFIRTADITAEGTWELAGYRAENLPEILISMSEHTTHSDAPYVYEQDELDARLRAFRAARGAANPEVTMTVTEVDEPDDDDVVELENRMRVVKERWHNMQHYFERSMQRGDVDSMRQARDELPQLGQSLLLLLTAMNRAIERGEQQEEYDHIHSARKARESRTPLG